MHAVVILKQPSFVLLFILTGIALFIGCSNSDADPADSGDSDINFVLGSLLEPFTPPSLEELDSQVEWIENETFDSLEMLRKRQATEPIEGTLEEALARRNANSADNAFILSALGRLPDEEEDVDWNASITRHTEGDIKSTNPLFSSSTTEFQVLGLTSIGLTGFTWDLIPYGSPDIVKTWHSSSDGLYDKFVLRDDVAWSDGEPVTAHDFAWTFQAIMSEGVPIRSRTSEEKLLWVEAYDDQTLVIFHEKSLVTNIWNCSLSVIPKHIYEDSISKDPTLQNSSYHVQHELKPVVAGAYEITKREQGQEIVLKAREAWYMHEGKQVRDRPHFQTIRFRSILDANTALLAIKSGRIEEKILNTEQWIGQTSGDDFYELNTKARGVEWTSFHFNWNCKTPYFSDVRVRRAMSYAFDYDEMHKCIHYNLYEPCNGVFHPASRWSPHNPPEFYSQDLDRAEALLAEAGWTDSNGDGILDKEVDGRRIPFEFTVLFRSDPVRRAVSILLSQSLRSIGIICHVRPMESTVLQQKTKDHNYEAYMGGWGTGADPFTLENIFGTGEDANFGEYSNPEVDRLFEEGLAEFDPAKREAIYGKIHLQLWEDQPNTWLYYRSSFYAFNKDLRGYVFSPRGPYSYGPGFSSIWKPAMH